MLAVLTANTDQDNTTSDTVLSLREAILLVNNAGDSNAALGRALTVEENAQINITEAFGTNDTIDFDPLVFATPQAIALGSQLPTISQELTITGPGQDLLTIDAGDGTDSAPGNGDGFRIFDINDGTGAMIDVELIGLTLTGGDIMGGSGGAIRSLENLTVTSSTVSGNSATGFGALGGGINSSGALTLTQSTVSGNSTTGSLSSGGGIFANGAVTLTGSTVSGNSTSGSSAHGGGILARGALTLTQSTVSGNSTSGSSARGGGMYVESAVTLTQSTVTDNHANSTGGGIWNDNDPVDISGSIVAGNTVGGGNPDLRPGTGTLTVGYSLIGDNAGTSLAEAQTPDAGGNLIGSAAGGGIIDPLLDLLADNGGPTETHALLAGSPAIHAGDPSIVFNAAEFDQRGSGFPRVLFDRIDIGAFEFNDTTLTIPP